MDRRELTSTPIMHLSKTRVDGRELTSAPLGLLRRLWQCMDMDRRELTATPIMHVGLGSILESLHLLLFVCSFVFGTVLIRLAES